MNLFIGIDLGTTGCRACAIDHDGRVHAKATTPLIPPRRKGAAIEQSPELWWQAVLEVLSTLLNEIPAESVQAIAIDGTSGTVLLADESGRPLTPALMYNDARATLEAELIAEHAPRESAAHGASSGLAKLLWLLRHTDGAAARVHSQAEWINGRLTGTFGISDTNNALKLGYDAMSGNWPSWLQDLGVPANLLPQVVEPGTPIDTIHPSRLTELRLPAGVMVVAGTTDSTAAFIATGAGEAGEAVTSLGSTLVAKVISERPIFAPEYGVYSQPLDEHWLVGGGSNSGGEVLRQFFSDEQMKLLTPKLLPEVPTGLDYYPLPGPGERFPVNDPSLAPRITPRPAERVVFFQGLLEGIARIEYQAYRRLAELGAPYPTSVRSVGGGAVNAAWTRIRGDLLGVPMLSPEHSEAAYGAALLARRSFIQ